jgi:hypothetical protein
MALTYAQIRGMTYNQLGAALVSGLVTEKQLRNYYTAERSRAQAAARRIAKSDVGFYDGETPYFTKLRNLTTTGSLVHAVVDVSRFTSSKRSTVGGRRKVQQQTISTLHSRGIDFVDESNYREWISFIQWFKASEFAAYYDSDSEAVADVFEAGSNAREWAQLFRVYQSGDWEG